MMAVTGGQREALELLIKSGAELHHQYEYDNSLVMLAVQGGPSSPSLLSPSPYPCEPRHMRPAWCATAPPLADSPSPAPSISSSPAWLLSGARLRGHVCSPRVPAGHSGILQALIAAGADLSVADEDG